MMVKRMQIDVGSQIERNPQECLIIIHIKTQLKLNFGNHLRIYHRNSKIKSQRQTCGRKITIPTVSVGESKYCKEGKRKVNFLAKL